MHNQMRNMYFSMGTGFTFLSKEEYNGKDSKIVFEPIVAIGMTAGKGSDITYRHEVAISYYNNKDDDRWNNSIEETTYSLIYNLYIDFMKGSMIRPFVKGGVGVALEQIESSFSEATTTIRFAMRTQPSFGVSVNLSEQLAVSIESFAVSQYLKPSYRGTQVGLNLSGRLIF